MLWPVPCFNDGNGARLDVLKIRIDYWQNSIEGLRRLDEFCTEWIKANEMWINSKARKEQKEKEDDDSEENSVQDCFKCNFLVILFKKVQLGPLICRLSFCCRCNAIYCN